MQRIHSEEEHPGPVCDRRGPAEKHGCGIRMPEAVHEAAGLVRCPHPHHRGFVIQFDEQRSGLVESRLEADGAREPGGELGTFGVVPRHAAFQFDPKARFRL